MPRLLIQDNDSWTSSGVKNSDLHNGLDRTAAMPYVIFICALWKLERVSEGRKLCWLVVRQNLAKTSLRMLLWTNRIFFLLLDYFKFKREPRATSVFDGKTDRQLKSTKSSDVGSRGEGHSQKNWVGVCDPFPKTLALLSYDQNLRYSLIYLWPYQKLETLFMTWPLHQNPVSYLRYNYFSSSDQC